MSLEDLLSTVQPFGQSMAAGKRSVGPRSAKFRVAARRLGGKFTPEGRQMLMKGEQLRLMEPNISTPESRNLINRGEEIKAAYASGGLKFAKDLKPLRRQWFQDVQAANLSAEDKEGIRQMFSQDFLDAGKELDAEAQRNFNLKNQKFGIQKARQDIQRNQQILQTGRLGLKQAESDFNRQQEAIKNEAGVSEEIFKIKEDLRQATYLRDENGNVIERQTPDGPVPMEMLGEDAEKARLKANERALDAITGILATKPNLTPSSLRALDSVAQQAGKKVTRLESLKDRKDANQRAIQSQLLNIGVPLGIKDLNFSNNEPATITENLRKVTKAIKNNLIITQGRKATEDKINLIKEIAVPYMASLKDFPESSEDYESMPDRVEAGREFLNGYAERARDFMERIGLEDPNLKQTLDNIIKEISAEEWANEATGAVIGSEYYSVASKIENLMIAINGSLYSPLLKQVTEAEEEARKKAEEGY
tara:strand:- start:10389 stop:11822 length:1434 start_codon:yes stop_codon:yes gene_type:complete